ncbi:MAG: hypothetical protein RIT27_129 [Pseudomonadota bacterium]|jgi:hypothetical protein
MRFLLLLIALLFNQPTMAFCGFYVAKGDAKLFNKASQVVLVRQDDKTVLTMANDFRGEMKEFAVVIPVPTVIKKNQIHIGNKAHIDHLDAYTAPRLVEYFDENPCNDQRRYKSMPLPAAAPKMEAADKNTAKKDYKVKIEASYTVGEYDILILSAEESDGLSNWLKDNDYKIPDGAEEVLGSYIKQNMKFFVAKVNVSEQSKLGFNYLRPIQVAYESPKFMLPIRLGTVNSEGTQDLFVYALTSKGRVETTNYRTIKLPSNMDVPVYIKNDFQNFYKTLFDKQVEKENMRAVFLEYAWDMNWCDPCAADPLSPQELRQLGVFWLNDNKEMAKINMPQGPAQNVFVSRLHVRYNAENFPEDLVFQETADRNNFQGRYVLRHAWKGEMNCSAAKDYRKRLNERLEKEAQTLATLTGWDINQIRTNIEFPAQITDEPPSGNWWENLWKDKDE